MVTRGPEGKVAPLNGAETSIRSSQVAYILAKLRIRGVDYVLLNAHRKWGDWSLLGGHVEASDATWQAAAEREVSEELAPLLYGKDIEVRPGEVGRLEWGPVASRSAGGVPTEYRARCYALRFKSDPRVCLSKLPQEEFALIRLSDLAHAPRISSVVEKAGRLLGGWKELPLSWDADLDDAPFGPSATESAYSG